ncbi:bifunctional hydroxymethylpyrimidine kinase/phosphomethylpyrimidine kinase [Antarctobacter jejuensis]|uniref:bifunctional hydroxymethylpyrimidine kinase/phosphomethylpyrimidine kinase n=1 Tax=Antarctobacter jejuensis TaxID=1439938 RepID=UPI003FD11FF5
MARLLILSSWVAHGHVGLSAAEPALTLLGHSVTALPTVLLSNHPGWPYVAGTPVDPAQIAAMIEALEANGWLTEVDAVLVGYLPTPGHVALAVSLIERLRGLPTPPRVILDPVLGDAPKGLYLPKDVALALRDTLMPLADVLTPNLFELGWLSGQAVDTLDKAQAAATLLMRAGPAEVHVTSAPVGPEATGLLQVTKDGANLYPTALRKGVPHGVGDVFAAFIAAGLTPGEALGHLTALIDASLYAPHLRIVQAPAWTRATPLTASEN